MRHLHGINGTYKLVLEVICESRGLSNLTPARSRLFKLIGKDGVMRWSCSGSKHIWWLTYARESEKRSNGTVVI